MILYYHATSFVNAISIEREGFRRSARGALGAGVYFAEQPKSALNKAQCSVLDAIIVVHLDTGKIKEVTCWHNWTKQELNSLGYDSVRRINCPSGNEICIFETNRIKIIGIVHWDRSTIVIKEFYSNLINVSKFHFLTEKRKLQIIVANTNGSFNWSTQQFILFGSYALSNI